MNFGESKLLVIRRGHSTAKETQEKIKVKKLQEVKIKRSETLKNITDSIATCSLLQLYNIHTLRQTNQTAAKETKSEKGEKKEETENPKS